MKVCDTGHRKVSVVSINRCPLFFFRQNMSVINCPLYSGVRRAEFRCITSVIDSVRSTLEYFQLTTHICLFLSCKSFFSPFLLLHLNEGINLKNNLKVIPPRDEGNKNFFHLKIDATDYNVTLVIFVPSIVLYFIFCYFFSINLEYKGFYDFLL